MSIRNKLVTVGLDENHNLINVDLSTLKLSNLPMGIDEVNFNEAKYLSCIKKNKLVYTVLYIVYNELNEDDIVGYVVSDNYGNISLCNLKMLCSLIESYPCMSYYLITKNKKYFIRKYHNLDIATIKDSELKSIYGYNFGDYRLRDKMTLEELDFCMTHNGFKLGYAVEFSTSCYHIIYFNTDGYQIIFNIKNDSLTYYGNSLVMMGHINHSNYLHYLKKYNYFMGSSSPVDGGETDILISSNTNQSRYFKIVDLASSYSEPCIPYYISESCEGDMEMLHITRSQRDFIDKYFEEAGGEESGVFSSNKKKPSYALTLKHFALSYAGYKNIFRYSDDLQYFYSHYKSYYLNYLIDFYIKRYGFTFEQIKLLMSDLDKYV